MGRTLQVWLFIQLCAGLGAVAQRNVQYPPPLSYLTDFGEELQEAAYKVLQQENWQNEFPEFNMPSDFMHSFIPDTGVGNREDLEIDVISSTPVYSDMNFTKWHYERFKNSDYVLGIHKDHVTLWRTSVTDKMPFYFASADAVFIYYPEDRSFVLDTILFSRYVNHREVLYVAVLVRNSDSDVIRIYEITNSDDILVTIINLGQRTTKESGVNRNKLAYVHSQHQSSLVVLVDKKGENKILYQRKGSSTMNHYIEVQCESPVDLVTFSVNGHGYIAVASTTTAEVFKMDYYLQDHKSFERFPYGENIVDLEYFRLGFHHYLAIADENYQTLYVWKSGGFFSKQQFYLSDARQWYSALLPTCRDDVILFLIQKHSAEVFVWDGKEEKFAQVLYVVPFGFKPLSGSMTSFSYNMTAFLLFVNEKEESEMATIETRLKPVPDPVLIAGKDVSNMMEKLQKMMAEQYEQMKNISNILNNAVRYSGNQTFTVRQTFENLEVKDSLSSELLETKVTWKNSPLTIEEFLRGAEVLESAVKSLEDRLNAIEEILKDIVKIDENAVITGPKTLTISHGNFLKTNALFIESAAGMNIRKAQNEIYRIDKPQRISGVVEFSKINLLEDMDVELTVNGLDFSEELMITDLPQESTASMIFTEKLNILGNLSLSGKVNDIDISNDIVRLHGSEEIIGKKIFLDGIIAENVHTSLLDGVDITELDRKALKQTGDQLISGNVTFNGALYASEINLSGLINGNKISSLSESLVRINKPEEIRGSKSFRSITIENDLDVDLIDNTKIPEDLLMPNEQQVISGVKNFIGSVAANDVTVIGKVNGLDLPSDIITLTEEETIDSRLNFVSGITVQNDITVHGLIDGIDIKKLMTRTLSNKQVSGMKDLVFSGPLTILGNLDVEGNINGIPLEELVKDLVFKEDKDLVFSAPKTYSSIVAGSVTVKDKINKYNLEKDFMFTEGNQTIRGVKTFKDPVTFHDVYTGDGKISGVDLAELYQTRIKLSAEDNPKLENVLVTENLIVDGFLNQVKFPDDFVLKSTVQNIANKRFEGDLIFDNLIIEGNLEVSEKFSGVSLPHFFDETLSLDGKEEILGDIFLGNTTAFSVKILGLVNDLDIVKFAENIMSLSQNQTITAYKEFSGNVHAFGRTSTYGINGYNLADIKKRAFKLHDTNVVTAPLTFRDTLTIENIFVEENINGVNFDDLVGDSVKTKGLQHITGENIFYKGFHVDGNINAEINGLNIFRDILRKKTPQEITGKYTFGSITVQENVEVDGLVNNIDLSEVSSQLAKRNQKNDIASNIVFKKPVDIRGNLEVSGLINGKDSSQLKDSLILETGDQYITGSKILEGNISIYGDIKATLINGVNWVDFLEDVVRIDIPQNVPAPKTFSSDLEVDGDIFVSEKASVGLINGINLEKLLNEAVFIDQAANISGPKVITSSTEISELIANLINGLNLQRDVITLQCVDEVDTQIITGSKEFENLEVMGHVIVEQYVNGHKLLDLYRNTFTTFGNQTVQGHKHFTNLLTAERNVHANAVNGLNVKHLIPLNENKDINASMTFVDDLLIEGDLNVAGLVNGIDLNTLGDILYVDTEQTITGPYVIDRARTESVSVKTINSLDLENFARSVNQFYEDTMSRKDRLLEISESQCHAAKYLRSVIEASYYTLDGLDIRQILNYSADSIEVDPETKDLILIQAIGEGSSVTGQRNSYDSYKNQFIFSADYLTTIVRRKSLQLGDHRLTINIGAESKESFISYDNEALVGIRGFADGDAVLIKNEVYLALLHDESGLCEMFTMRNFSSGYPSVFHEGSIFVGKEAKSLAVLQAAWGEVYVIFARKFDVTSATQSSTVYLWKNGWKPVQEIPATASSQVINFNHLNHNYLIFTNPIPVSETLEPQYIQVYRCTGDTSHPFKLFQRIQFDDAQGIEVFEFGNLPDLYLTTFNATGVQIYRLDGEAGFTSNFSLRGKCITTIKPMFVERKLFLVVSQHDRNYAAPSITVIYEGVTQGSIVPRKELEHCP